MNACEKFGESSDFQSFAHLNFFVAEFRKPFANLQVAETSETYETIGNFRKLSATSGNFRKLPETFGNFRKLQMSETY